MDFTRITSAMLGWLRSASDAAAQWAESPAFYTQVGVIVVAVSLAFVVALVIGRSPVFAKPAETARFYRARNTVHQLKDALFPFFALLALAVAVRVVISLEYQPWLTRVAESVALIYLLYSLITRYVTNSFIRAIGRWIGIPVATLAVFGWLETVTSFLDSVSLSAGNVRVSLYGLTRAFVFGAVLFWLGRVSNAAGKDAIRRQAHLDKGTREVAAKLFEISVFVVIFLLLLQIMGINLTTLAVFSGALGVGLGFGLQQIASNFISGIIILLDRSLAIGDHVEMEDGRSGTVRELNMRFGVIETYDGKDIVVPNEQFITTSYINWTHKDPRQRYSLEFQVAYSTDLDRLFEDLRRICDEHPQVLSGDDLPVDLRPDAEIAGFGDSGIDILVEFWMEAIDDGQNRVGADLLLSIYHLFREKDYEFPFPQREVRLLGEQVDVENV